MKTRTLLLTSIALLTFAASVALATDTGPRELASGMIEYEISTTGRGTTMTGTKTEWFADHGRRSATLEKKTTKTDAFGQKSTERTEELSIADGDTVYTIDLVNKTGTKMDVGALKAMGAAMAGKMMADGTLPKNLREFVEKNGGKWLPAEMFLGRKCDVYEVMGVRSWAYKGIILRTESSIAGVVTKEVAKTFEENASVPASRFEVPAGIKFEEPEGMAEAQSLVGGARPGSDEENGEAEDDGPPSTLPFAKFKQAVAKVQVSGFHRMPEITTEGDHGLILADDEDQGWTIMAQRSGIGAKLEEEAAGKLSRFKHKGHDAFYARITDPEGEEMAFILVKFPEYNMGLFVAAKPVAERDELMKVLAQVEL